MRPTKLLLDFYCERNRPLPTMPREIRCFRKPACAERGLTYEHIVFGIAPIGLGARDTLRLEMGFCLYGNDINDTTSPIEAGLGWITKFTKDFVSSEKFKAQKEAGVKQKLVGFVMEDKGIPRHDYLVVDESGNEIGKVTSGTQSPTLKQAIGMAYINTNYSKVDSEIFISVRDKSLKAKVVKLPFLKK
jgi:aminomethyltransferase